MARRHIDITTIQTWPGGTSYTYRGDPHGPVNQRSLRVTSYNGEPAKPWRKGTAAEWRTIRIALRAEGYQRHEIYHVDSSLVGDLIALSSECRGDLAEAFGYDYDAVRNLYGPDPSDWDAAQCREYAADNGITLPDPPTTDTPDGETVPEDGYEEDDSRHGWLTDARDVCREYMQDNPAEVYEWWRISPWLCARLHEIGEVTIDNQYGEWWGRTCTGQGLIMDGTLQRIAAAAEDAE